MPSDYYNQQIISYKTIEHFRKMFRHFAKLTILFIHEVCKKCYFRLLIQLLLFTISKSKALWDG